jgi:hypothetical protein
MVIYESRKKELAEVFGQDGCVVEKSWMTATFQDLNGEIKLYTDDVDFLYKDRTYCTTPESEVKTKVVINENNGVSADVAVNGNVIGKTNTFIEIVPGDYIATISLSGYVSKNVPFTTTLGETRYAYITLTKSTTDTIPDTPPDEYETPTQTGAVIRPTMNMKLPKPVIAGAYQWFGWEFSNVGDSIWKGIVGVKIVDSTGKEFKWLGDSTKKQTLTPDEAPKYVWAYCLVDAGIKVDANINIYALMTKTG